LHVGDIDVADTTEQNRDLESTGDPSAPSSADSTADSAAGVSTEPLHETIDAPLTDPVETSIDDGGMTDGVIPQRDMSTIDEPPGSTIPGSTYEMVVVAAREARRLNNRLRRLADEKPEKVTTRAIDRVLAGQVHFAYDDDIAGNL
jgi:DNA-directed RNA polymerase subunit K/omega